VAQAAKKTPARSTWRAGQTAPTPDRYREIQGALAKKGYLHGEASGVWNQDSADALRRFQQDQSLQASGKLDSLSIIALGLGPKY
jgi:peptidoglycan hydrolase-like protein with peptidoglycan-binding domain